MGYSTDFDGGIAIEPALSEEQVAWFNKFCDERHEEAGNPGIWCDLQVNEEGDELSWNGSEKTYNLDGWVAYHIKNYFRPKGHVLNGTLRAQGEDPDDMWRLIVRDNRVSSQALVPAPDGDESYDYDDGS